MTQETQERNEKIAEQKVGLRLQDVINPTSDRTTTLDYVCNQILNMDLENALEESRQVLTPYHSNGEKRPTLIISGASSASASQETECGILKTRGHIIDIPGAIEGRDTRSAQNGDVALISTSAGLMMAKAGGKVEIINLADEPVVNQGTSRCLKGSDIYYKADGLLLLILTNPTSPVIVKLVSELTKNPLIYPYNLDEETQLALLWLSKKAGLDHLNVNANSPEVGIELTRKGFRYPTIDEALMLPNYDDPYRMQMEEWKLSQAAREIGYHPDCVPGYVINRPETYEGFHIKVLKSLMLLATRYNLEIAWVKPDRGTDGGNQGPLSTNTSENQEATSTRIQEMWTQGGNWVIEAKTNYFKIKLLLDGIERTLMTTPSVHIIKGEPRYTISLQLVDGVAWGGNLICSCKTWERLVEMIDFSDPRIVNNLNLINQLKSIYNLMPKTMHDYVDAINKSKKYQNGQVRGGADLAVATLGGKFGHNNIVIAVQDYNARANGCETAYALYDLAQEVYGGQGEAITRNVTPKVDFNQFTSQLPQIIKLVNTEHGKNISIDQVKLIAVSAGWGQFGIIGTDPIEITQDILLLELQLRKSRLIQ